MLTFNAEGHKYWWDGKEVPSVSQILKTIGITRDYERVDEYYRQRGIYVHQAVQFHTKHTLDVTTVDPDNVLPYLKAFQKYESEKGYTVSKTEVPLYSQRYGFAGTIDQIGRFENPRYLGEGIADLKATEKSDKAAHLQLLLYESLFYENYNKWPSFRMVLELHEDGTPKPIFYDSNPKLVDAVMEIYNWKTTRRKST